MPMKREGQQVSVSTVGHILGQLKARGWLNKPPRSWVTVREWRLTRPYARRTPRESAAEKAGDLVQVDTADVRPPLACTR